MRAVRSRMDSAEQDGSAEGLPESDLQEPILGSPTKAAPATHFAGQTNEDAETVAGSSPAPQQSCCRVHR